MPRLQPGERMFLSSVAIPTGIESSCDAWPRIPKIGGFKGLRARCLLLAGLLMGLIPGAALAAEVIAPPPNIILVVADDLGWGALGAYGQETIPARTPTIDKLAAEGVRFTQFYAGSSVCAPSRCSLITGRHTGTCGIRGNRAVPLPAREPTIATHLKTLGYRTAMIGKWGLGGHNSAWAPRRKGFDYFFGFTDQGDAHNYYPEWVWENESRYTLEGNRARFRVAVEKATYVNDLFIEKALRFLEDHRDAPVFLFLPLTLPHTNSELEVLTGRGMEAPRNHYAEATDLNPYEQAHASMIREIDLTVAALVNKLKALGIENRSIVLLTSDNGSAPYYDPDNRFNENGGLRGKKGTLYEGGIRVPLVVWGPGCAIKHRVVDQPAAAWDLLPTFLDLAGAPTSNRRVPGVSLLPLLTGRGEQPSSRRPFYWELHLPPVVQAVRLGDWKLIRIGGRDGVLELYHLAKDPRELNNLAHRHPDIASALALRFDSLRVDNPHWPLERAAALKTVIAERPREGFGPSLPVGLPSEGPIRLVEIDPPGGSYYRSHLFYWSGGRVENFAFYKDWAKAGEKEKLFEDVLLPLLRKDPTEHIVFARQVTKSPANEAFQRFIRRHGWHPDVIHRYVERYSFQPDVELLVLHPEGPHRD
jgi:arylsulfatase A-like enzyme